MNATSTALRLVNSQKEEKSERKPVNSNAALKLHHTPSKRVYQKKAMSPGVTMAKTRKALRWEAKVLQMTGKVVAILSVLAEAIIYGLYHFAGQSMSVATDLLTLFTGVGIATSGIVTTMVLFAVSNSLLQEARRLRMEE